MPGMSGLELLPKAKALRPDVPVIMITAYGDAETKRKALENGAEALLTNQSTLGGCAMKSTCGLEAPRNPPNFTAVPQLSVYCCERRLLRDSNTSGMGTKQKN